MLLFKINRKAKSYIWAPIQNNNWQKTKENAFQYVSQTKKPNQPIAARDFF